jgi:hypothetical protein
MGYARDDEWRGGGAPQRSNARTDDALCVWARLVVVVIVVVVVVTFNIKYPYH